MRRLSSRGMCRLRRLWTLRFRGVGSCRVTRMLLRELDRVARERRMLRLRRVREMRRLRIHGLVAGWGLRLILRERTIPGLSTSGGFWADSGYCWLAERA